MRPSRKQLVGRKIVEIDWRPFDDGRGGKAFNPVVTLDDGSRLTLHAQEVESGDCYGVTINRTPKGGH